MKSFREIRQQAWQAAVSRWSFRSLTVLGFFMILQGAVFSWLAEYFDRNGIQTWGMFRELQMKFSQPGLELTAASARQACQMTVASAFEGFLEFLLLGIFLFGVVTVSLSALRGKDEGWLRRSFGGFGAPLDMLGLNLLFNLRVFLWSLLLVIPGVVAFFRYAMAWYVKADHPDYSASRCLAESGRLMEGRKLQFFLYELSYFGWYLLLAVVLVADRALSASVLPFSAAAFGYLLFLMVYAQFFGNAAFYEELRRISENKAESSATAVES